MLDLLRDQDLSRIQDVAVRDAIQRLYEGFRDVDLLKGRFEFFEITLSGAVTNFKYKHNLGFEPKDVIQTSLTGAGSLTWNYTLFSQTELDITTTGACVVRAFVGRFSET